MPELRKDPILGRWVIIASERSKRPGGYHSDKRAAFTRPGKCPFCEGHEKMTPPEVFALRNKGSKPDGPGWRVRVVPNKYPALKLGASVGISSRGLYSSLPGHGVHEVLIETTDHKKEADSQTISQIEDWIGVLQARSQVLSRDSGLRYTLVFKNKGRYAGASLSHPHHQIISTPIVPKRVKEELKGAADYFRSAKSCVFCDIIREEEKRGQRVIGRNRDFIAFCPYASRFPFEIWIVPRLHSLHFHDPRIAKMNGSLARILKSALNGLKTVLDGPEYNYIVHVAPSRIPKDELGITTKSYHWHIELFPRLVRTAGFEWGTGFYINPTSPEDAAGYLREAAGSRPV